MNKNTAWIKNIQFTLNKSHYHLERFRNEYERTIEDIRTQSKERILGNIKIEDTWFNGTQEIKITEAIHGELSNPCFFEFDSFMVECKRFIDYIVLDLIVKLGFPLPKKGTESFFKSLNPQVKETRRGVCEKIILEYPALASFLWESWLKWIKTVHTYRTKSVHKYIPNTISGKMEIFWNSVAKKESPTKVTLDVYFHDAHRELIPIDLYLKDVEKNMDDFLVKTYVLFEGIKIELPSWHKN